MLNELKLILNPSIVILIIFLIVERLLYWVLKDQNPLSIARMIKVSMNFQSKEGRKDFIRLKNPFLFLKN